MRSHAFFMGTCGLVVLSLALACSGKNETRKDEETGGSAGTTATGGAGATTLTGGTAGGSTGGTGGTSSGGKGGSAAGGTGGSATGGTGGSAAGSGGSAGSGNAYLDLYREIFRAQCEFDERCASTNGRAFVSLEACQAYYEYFLVIFEQVLEEEGAFLSDITFLPGDHRACALTLYPASTCEKPPNNVLSPECDAVVDFGETIEAGGVCSTASESIGVCAPGNSCRTENGCGYCEPTVNLQNGSACEYASDCVSEACVDGLCVTPKGRGETCTSELECRSYLGCFGEAGAMVCGDAADVGAPCGQTLNARCLNGLSCWGEPPVCVLDAATGAECDRTGAVSCIAVCVFSAPDAATGRCGADLAHLGEPCAYSGTTATCSEGYAKRTLNAEGVNTACVCAPREPAGAPCRGSADCESYRCTGSSFNDPTVMGVCEPFSQIGEACTSNIHCASGFCAEDTLCAAPPTCSSPG